MSRFKLSITNTNLINKPAKIILMIFTGISMYLFIAVPIILFTNSQILPLIPAYGAGLYTPFLLFFFILFYFKYKEYKLINYQNYFIVFNFITLFAITAYTFYFLFTNAGNL